MTNIGLFGYGEMGLTSLEATSKNFNIIWIVLPPKNIQTDTERKTEALARKNGLKIIYETIPSKIHQVISNSLPKLILICSFNKILPDKTIRLVNFINVHLGDLPKYRGRANVNWSIINGEKEIVISVHKVTPDLDGGNIYAKYPIKIEDHESVGDVYEKINKKLAKEISPLLQKVVGGFKGAKQKGNATYCVTRLPSDGIINFNDTTQNIFNFIRAQSKPYPGAFTYYNNKKMTVWSSIIPKSPKKYVGRVPGRIIQIDLEGVEVMTRDSSIIIEKVNYNRKDLKANQVIKSVKTTLGINWVYLFEKIIK